MLSKSKIKLIKSLEKRKYRAENGLFVAEGPKLVCELSAVMQPAYIAVLPEWADRFTQILPEGTQMDVVTDDELRRASFLKAPQGVIALFPIPYYIWEAGTAQRNLCLALDGVQDPGNLGTIVRLADWFGITDVLCSPATADVFSPKAVQATMGALAHVRLHYVSLPEALSQVGAPVYGTFLDGVDIRHEPLGQTGIIVMGNEGNGITEEVERLVTHRLFIPSFSAERPTTESLNVAVAAGIVCAEFRRREP